MSEFSGEFKYSFSLTSQWTQKFIDELGCTFRDNQLYFPEEIASGSCSFLEVLPELSVLAIDAVINKEIHFTRLPTPEDFWIINYDLSDCFNKHVVDNINHKIGYHSNLDFAIIDNQIKSIYLSKGGAKTFFLRLFIRKSFIKSLFTNSDMEREFIDVFDDNEKKMFFYGHIDSRSKVFLFNLKNQDMNSPNYELLLKSSVFHLLSCLIERLNSSMPSTTNFLEKDLEAVLQSQKHLLSDLLKPFPGIVFLADNANMSISKYRNLYKTIFGISPVLFFRNEKLLLAKELLESGNYKYISDVAFELGYLKTTYFSTIYKEFFGVLPNTALRSI